VPSGGWVGQIAECVQASANMKASRIGKRSNCDRARRPGLRCTHVAEEPAPCGGCDRDNRTRHRREHDRLVVATAQMRQRNAVDLPFSGPDFFDLRRGATTMFEAFAAVQTGRTVVRQEDGTVEQVRFASVSHYRAVSSHRSHGVGVTRAPRGGG
jgi:hypothetical protein